MILDLIEEYYQLKFDTLNSSLPAGDQLRQVDNDLMQDAYANTPKIYDWRLFIPDTDPVGSESRAHDEIRTRIQFYFLIKNRNRTAYKTFFNQYVWGMRNMLRRNELAPHLPYKNVTISTELTLNGLAEIVIRNADLFEGDFYLPSIEGTFMVSQQ